MPKPVEPTTRPRAILHDALNVQAGIIRTQAAMIARQEVLLEASAVRTAALERQMAFVARAAGIENDLAAIAEPAQRRFASLMKQADERNPAQPVPQPGSEGPAETTEMARAPRGMDDVTQMGASPVTDVSPNAVTDVNQPYGTEAFAPLDLNKIDVTAPVAGTETMRPPQETITDVEVRVGNPDNPQPAFPWNMGPVGAQPAPVQGPSVGAPGATASRTAANAEARVYGSLRLARLRIQAGIADTTDDLGLGQTIARSEMTDAAILQEINVLGQVSKAASRGTQGAPGARVASARHLVPRAASREAGERSTPSLSTTPETGFEPRVASMSPDDEEFLFDA